MCQRRVLLPRQLGEETPMLTCSGCFVAQITKRCSGCRVARFCRAYHQKRSSSPLAVLLAAMMLVPPQSCVDPCGGYAGRCWRPRSPCIGSSGGCAGFSCAPSEAALRSPLSLPPPFPVEGPAGALGAAEGVRAAEGFAAHGAGEGAVEQRGAVGGRRRHGEARAWLDDRCDDR